jgi:acyl-CoA synthetase (AMP-forming)/AMP-acid ligase II
MFACSKLGAYFTLYNYAYTPSELVNALQATTPKVLLATLTTCRFNYEPVLKKLEQSFPDLSKVILLDDIATPDKTIFEGCNFFVRYNELMGTVGEEDILPIRKMEKLVQDSNILNLQFTSGSTGSPKTAALTHHGMLNSARYIGMQMRVKSSDRINVPVPLFHAFGLVIGKTLHNTVLVSGDTDNYRRIVYGLHVWRRDCVALRVL